MLADRPAAHAAAAPQRPPASADGRAVQHRERHRGRPPGAARHRRRAGVPRPLPPRVPDDPAGRASHVARLQSVLDALQVLLPGIFVVVVVWLGARSPSGARSRAGELVAFYGYSAFLMIPLRTGHRVRQQDHPRPGSRPPGVPRAGPEARTSWTRTSWRRHRRPGAELDDARSGLRRAPGPAHRDRVRAARRRRPRSPTGSGMAAAEVDDDVTPRRRPAHRAARAPRCAAGSSSPTPASTLFSGRLARPARRRRPAAASQRALATASGEDILDALPDGLDDRRGRARPDASPVASGSGSCWPAR